MFDSEAEFFDELYQLWSMTTGAGDRYWMPEEFDDRSGRFKIYGVAEGDKQRKLVAAGLNERDAEFIAGLHGAVPDLIRALHEAVAESDRADYDRDTLAIYQAYSPAIADAALAAATGMWWRTDSMMCRSTIRPRIDGR